MIADNPLESLRLGFKRAFMAYYLELRSPGIADPTRSFSSGYAYLSALLDQLGAREFRCRLDDETTDLAGQLEQDLRYRLRGKPASFCYDDLEDRLRECFEYAHGRLKEQGRLEGERL